MTGETDLATLLASMQPRLLDDEYVFCTIAGAEYGDHAELTPLASYRESEGLTLVLTKAAADSAGLAYEGAFRGITLMVHSSLEAVGLTAAVAGKLAERGISANVIAAYYHDHIFVQADKAGAAVEALQELAG